MPELSAVIISYNEEKYIEKCLKSLEGIADEIVVVDSLSTDKTAEICSRFNVRFIQQKFLGYREQKEFAMQQAKYDYILSLDADEALSQELKESIYKVKNNWKFDGYRFNRLNNYCGKWIYHTNLYPERKVRLFDRRKGHWGGINPHDKFILNPQSKTGFLKGNLLHWIYETLEEHTEKINKFSSISAKEYYKLGIRAPAWKIILKPSWRFFHSFFIKLGFLHGCTGFIISKNLAHHCFIKYAKLRLITREQKRKNPTFVTDKRIKIAGVSESSFTTTNAKFNAEMNAPSLSIIITTYNQPDWLKKVLWGYENQSFTNFEVIISDDGSGPETKAIVDEFIQNSSLNIIHVWHPDEGYQKCKILNKGIMASRADYILFTDGDCIPRRDFVETHINNSEKGFFLSGGAIRLPLELSHKITKEDISNQRAFDVRWLYKGGLPKNIKSSKLFKSSCFGRLMNIITPANASWNGGNSSGWKSDFIAINGFNEDMLYGGQDREFGERLMNFGLKSKQIRYSAICLHLDHGRPYKTKESIDKNRALRNTVKRTKIIRTVNGIEKILQSSTQKTI